MIKLLYKNCSEISLVDYDTFKKKMGVTWRKQICFFTDKDEKKARLKAAGAVKKKELDLREKWLGFRFQHEIKAGKLPDVSIRYIDSVVNYGVFAEEEIFKGQFLGEYTGIIRKRKRSSDKKNDYCFQYSIGNWIFNPYIIDAKNEGNMTRYMNHCTNPNVESLGVFANGLMHIIFIAEKKIGKGEQLRYHYGERFWKKRKRAVI